MAKTKTREWTETGPDGKPVRMVTIIDEASDIPDAAWGVPKASPAEIREAIAVHELALVTAIRDAKATYGDGRIYQLARTIEILKAMEDA